MAQDWVHVAQVHVAQDRVRNLRRITACFKKLGEVCEVTASPLRPRHRSLRPHLPPPRPRTHLRKSVINM